MRTIWISAAACLSVGCTSARAWEADPIVRAALEKQVAGYLETTRQDLKSDSRYPNLEVNLISSEMMPPSGSLVTPHTAEVRYILEYDDSRNKGARAVHPFLMTCSFFDGRWDISPHGHRERKNLKDLDPEKSKMLFPNI